MGESIICRYVSVSEFKMIRAAANKQLCSRLDQWSGYLKGLQVIFIEMTLNPGEVGAGPLDIQTFEARC